MLWYRILLVSMVGLFTLPLQGSNNKQKSSNSSGLIKPVTQFVQQHKVVSGTIIATALFSVASFGAVLALLHKEKKTSGYFKKKYGNLKAFLEKLQGQYDALPIHDFEVQADKKIAEVRKLLHSDFSQHRSVLLKDLETLRGEINHLNAELQSRQRYLENTQRLLDSMRDNRGNTFIEDLTRIRTEIELAMNTARTQSDALAHRIAEVSGRMDVIRSRVTEFDALVAQFDRSIAQSKAVHDSLTHTLSAVTLAKGAIMASNTEFAQVNADARANLAHLRNAAYTLQTERAQLDSQLQNVRSMIERARSQAHQLMRDQENTAHESKSTSFVTPQPSVSDPEVVRRAVNALIGVLQPYSNNQLVGSAAFRSAYDAFCRHNQVNSSNSSAGLSSLARLYNCMIQSGCLDAPVSSLSTSVKSTLMQSTQEVLSYFPRS